MKYIPRLHKIIPPEIYYIYLLCVIITIVHTEHVEPINTFLEWPWLLTGDLWYKSTNINSCTIYNETRQVNNMLHV